MYQLGECYIYFEDFLYGNFVVYAMTNNVYVIYCVVIFIGAYVFYSWSIARSFGVSCLPTTPRVQLLARCPESSCSKS